MIYSAAIAKLKHKSHLEHDLSMFDNLPPPVKYM